MITYFTYINCKRLIVYRIHNDVLQFQLFSNEKTYFIDSSYNNYEELLNNYKKYVKIMEIKDE